ncbi:protein RALF-like 33-like [Dorcoceras hygrometricum]|nr:protein RALF-like 33-like [Dorcoceras hygrometricum]
MQDLTNKAHKMPQPSRNILLSILLLRCFFHDHVGTCEGVSVLDLNPARLSDSSEMAKRVCAEKMAGSEGEMDSESNRRVLLLRRRYISYDTLMPGFGALQQARGFLLQL